MEKLNEYKVTVSFLLTNKKDASRALWKSPE